MDFDDSFFELEKGEEEEEGKRQCDGGKRQGRKERKQSKYTAKICTREWFTSVDAGSSEEGAHVVLKYRADLCYRERQLQGASDLYCRVLEVLPSSNTIVRREVIDSLTRCHLGLSEPATAMKYATELVAPPHNNDASSWQLMALCHQNLGQREDWVLAMQRCNLIQRYHISYWLQLADAYTALHSVCTDTNCTKLESREGAILGKTDAIFSNTDAIFSSTGSSNVGASLSIAGTVDSAASEESSATIGDAAIFSNIEIILSNTVTLLRPYFKWKTYNSSSDVETTQTSFQDVLVSVSELLGKQTSVETFTEGLHRLPRQQRLRLVGVTFQVAACCCLIWAKQVQRYTLRHCSSFVRHTQTERLKHVERLIDGYHDDLTHYLLECFNHPTIFEDKS